MDQNQRAMVMRGVLSNPHTREAIIGGLQEQRATAIQGLLQHTDPAHMHRAQGRVHMLDEIIEEYRQWLTA